MNDLSDHRSLHDSLSSDLSNARKQGHPLDSLSLPQGFLTSLHKYKELQSLSLQIFPRIQQIFSTEGQIYPELCDQAIYDLKNIIVLLKTQTTSLNNALLDQQESKTSLFNYQLMITLYYLDELLIQLITLIGQIRSMHRSKSRQVIHLREEILYKLALATKSINDITQKTQILSDQARFQKRRARQPDSQMVLHQ
jgi:hypothetical protein